MNILRLNFDALWYISLFLKDPRDFWYFLPFKQDLFKLFDCYHFEEFKQMAKYVKFGGYKRIKFVIKHFDKQIFKFCLKKIKNIDYFLIFKWAFRYNNLNALKQVMKYENACFLKKIKHYWGLKKHLNNKYRESVKNGCCENMDILKYYLSHSIHRYALEKSVLDLIESRYTELEKYDKLMDSVIESTFGESWGMFIGPNFWPRSYNCYMSSFLTETKYFTHNYLFYKNIFYIDTTRFKELFKKYNTDGVLTDYFEQKCFNFDFTFEEYE